VIREVTFATPKGTEVLSGNQMRRMHHFAEGSLAKRQRKLVVVALLDAFARHMPRRLLDDGRRNVFRVTLTRITKSGTGFEEHDNLRTGCKYYVDAIAAVIFRGAAAVLSALNDASGKEWKAMAGRDDGHREISWGYEQQRATDLTGLRVHIEDLEPGEPMIVLSATATLAGAPTSKGRPEKPRPLASSQQQQLLFRPAWIALPWLQTDPNADCFENLVEGDRLARMLDAPIYIEPIDPGTQRPVRLWRHDHFDADLGGRVWLYCTIKPAGVSAEQHRRTK